MPLRRTLAALLVVAGGLTAGHADGATIVASYDAGHRDVLINDYGARAIGTFRLSDGTDHHLALCVEADTAHSVATDAYRRVANELASPELDVLVWLLDRTERLDDDTAAAGAALAWYLAGARRTIGVAVWSDGSAGFAPIGPLAPEPWDDLPPFSRSHPVGLRAGGIDLDRAERRVADLARLVAARRGPWQLIGDPSRPGFVLTGPGGAIPDEPVIVTVRSPGRPPIRRTLRTDATGTVTIMISAVPDGATLEAEADAPGEHREWDGAPGVQRMVTATTDHLTARFTVPPLPRHVAVRKESTDPTIGVAGAEFALLDANGEIVERVTAGADGRARFAPIDPVAHPAPLTIRETVAPPGLAVTASDVVLSTASHDATTPTVAAFVDGPRTVPVRVAKRLSVPEVGPTDRAGFAFSVVRREDGRSDELVTGADGRTEPVELPLGTYDVCETGVPPWAAGLVDGGCRSLTISLAELTEGGEIAIQYWNTVPEPTIDTRAADAADGDATLTTEGAVIVDSVELAGLVPGTTYTVAGELVTVTTDGPRSTGIDASTTFTAQAASAVVDVVFGAAAIPEGRAVVVERLLVGDVVLARHEDLDDPDQTLTVLSPQTSGIATTSTATTTTTAATTTEAPPTTTTGAPPTTRVVTTPVAASSTLPPTGPDAVALALRIGDLGFVAGVGLVVLAGGLPGTRRRRGTKPRRPLRRSARVLSRAD